MQDGIKNKYVMSMLLLGAAGTGKTFMFFQIIYRLWKAGISNLS